MRARNTTERLNEWRVVYQRYEGAHHHLVGFVEASPDNNLQAVIEAVYVRFPEAVIDSISLVHNEGNA